MEVGGGVEGGLRVEEGEARRRRGYKNMRVDGEEGLEMGLKEGRVDGGEGRWRKRGEMGRV